MDHYSLFHLSDGALTANLASVVSRDRETTASLLAHVAEFDARRLYAPAGFSSMHGYCVGVLGLSEDAAFKRITAARTAREHKVIFAMVADGRLHLTAIVRLAPHLNLLSGKDATSLLEAAAGRSKSEIESLLAERFPRPDLKASVRALPGRDVRRLVPEPVGATGAARAPESASGSGADLRAGSGAPAAELVPEPVGSPGRALVPEPVGTPEAKQARPAFSGSTPPPRIALRSPERYGVQFTMGKATHDLLRYAEDLVGRRLGAEELEEALADGLKARIKNLEKRRFAATDSPRAPRKASSSRRIPADVKRKVLARDGGRCTFVSDDGRRCNSRRHVEFDHIVPIARGGRSTLENVRLLCRTHNQLAADRVFGAGFMRGIRESRRTVAAGAHAEAGSPSGAPGP